MEKEYQELKVEKNGIVSIVKVPIKEKKVANRGRKWGRYFLIMFVIILTANVFTSNHIPVFFGVLEIVLATELSYSLFEREYSSKWMRISLGLFTIIASGVLWYLYSFYMGI